MNGTKYQHLLEVDNLRVSFRTGKKTFFEAVKGISFVVPANSTVALVGESGSGKSVSALAIMGLLPPENVVIDAASDIRYRGESLFGMTPRERRKLCGSEISMVFQEPMSSLNPVFTVGAQIGEVLRLHMGMDAQQAKRRAVELLHEVGIVDPEHKVDAYPHQLSGGQQQRVMIAMAIACEPQLLIADEPTTALDVTIQAQILDLLREIQKKLGTATVFVTHDLGVVARIADRVAVMYAGKIVEIGTVDEIFYDPRHPYTWGLLRSIPAFSRGKESLPSIPGMPPSLLHPPKGDAFASRNAYALEIDFEEEPPMFRVTDSHYAATWLLHPDAPKVEIPKIITDRIARMKEKGGKSNA